MESLYAKGSRLSLSVLQRGYRGVPGPGQQLTVEVAEPAFPPTMSVVMRVSFRDAYSGRQTLAVLKMYDRRFSPSLRRTYNPSYDDDAESAWRGYVRDGKAPALFAFLDEKRRQEDGEGDLIDTDSETDPDCSDNDGDEGAGVVGKKKKPPPDGRRDA